MIVGPKLDRNRPAYSYIRVNAGDRDELLRRRLACSLLAASAGVRLVREFVDPARGSGDQPGFNSLLDAVAHQPGGAYLLLGSPDQLGPSAKIRRIRARAIRAAGGQVVVLNGVEILPSKEAP